MQQGHFSKNSLRKNIVAFRLLGYFTWNEEAAGSNPVYYTNVGASLFGKASVCATEEQGSNPGVNQ